MQTEAQHLNVLNSIPSQIAVLDANGTIIQVNEAWAAFALENGGPESLANGVGTNYLEVCQVADGPWADEAPEAYSGIRAVLNGDLDVYSLEYPCHSDTEKRWFLMTVSPFKGEQGRAVISHLNITERKLAELRETSFDRILEQSLNEIFVFDAETLQFIRVNDGARKNLGYTMTELRSLTPVDIKPDHTNQTFEAVIKPLRDGTLERLEFETVHQRKNGSRYPVEVHLQRMELEDVPVFAAIILDITEKTQTQADLKQARTFLEAAPDATLIVNQKGQIEFANSQTIALLGYTPQELSGMAVESLVPERFRAGHVGLREQFSANPNVRSMGAELELYVVTKDGREIPIEVSLSPIRTEDGTLVAAALRDVTARKEAQHALLESEAALKLAKDEAVSATDTKTRFLAAASHDLRQPLQALRLYLSVLTRTHDQPKQVEIDEKMSHSLDTMGELLDALLDISKLDGGSVTPQKRDIRALELLDRIVTSSIQQAEEKGLRLVLSSEDVVIHSDPALLERVIDNFVTNAIRYTEKGQISIHCELGETSLRIAVTDTGVGIAPEALDKVFEEYYQLDNPVRDRRKGLGLGLSIVKHIARLLDHPIKVTSVPGEGSTFSVEVPLGINDVARKETTATQQPKVPASRNPVVLFIDDDPSIVDATTMLLESSGFEVHSALSGEEALVHLTDGVHPDVVISDYRLPGYNGVEVIRRVRAALNTDLAAVLMTGDTSAKEIEDAKLPNCTILHKPVDTDRLILLIETQVG